MNPDSEKLEEIEYLEEKVAPEVERLEKYVFDLKVEEGYLFHRYVIAKRVLIKLRQQKDELVEKLKVEDK